MTSRRRVLRRMLAWHRWAAHYRPKGYEGRELHGMGNASSYLHLMNQLMRLNYVHRKKRPKGSSA